MNINQNNPIEVFLGIVFVLVAVLLLLGTFAVTILAVLGNLRDKWPEYSTYLRVRALIRITLTLATLAILFVLASQQLA